MFKIQEDGSILRVGFALSKSPHTVIRKDIGIDFPDMGPLPVNYLLIKVLLLEKKKFNPGFFFYRPISSLTL